MTDFRTNTEKRIEAGQAINNTWQVVSRQYELSRFNVDEAFKLWYPIVSRLSAWAREQDEHTAAEDNLQRIASDNARRTP